MSDWLTIDEAIAEFNTDKQAIGRYVRCGYVDTQDDDAGVRRFSREALAVVLATVAVGAADTVGEPEWVTYSHLVDTHGIRRGWLDSYVQSGAVVAQGGTYNLSQVKEALGLDPDQTKRPHRYE